MAAIHRLSSVKPLNEFDIFSVPPTQSTIEQDILTEHRPSSSLDSRAFIEFNFSTAIDEYVRPDRTLFYIRLRLIIEKPLRTKIEKKDWENVSLINNSFYSLFKSIDFKIGDRIINPPHQTLPHKTDIDIKLGRNKEIKNTLFSTILWFEPPETSDKSIKKITDLLRPFDSTDDWSIGREIDMIGRLPLSLFEQSKALIGGCNYQLKFIPNDPSFYTMVPNDVRIKSVEFTDATLFIHRSKISPHVLQAHTKALESANARYLLRESFVVPITINRGTQDTILDNIHNGQLPKRAFVTFVDHSAFNGSTLLNPYNYQNFNLCHLAFYLNGIQYPEKPFTPDFDNELYVREYNSLFEATNQDIENNCINISREEFPKGNNIFAVNFNPDLSSGCCAVGHVNPIKFGSLRLQVRFKKPLPKTITALVYLDYDTILEINKDRNPIFNFN